MPLAPRSLLHALFRPVSAAPLITFRFVFGLLMCFSAVRFMALGWIEDHYVQPIFHFKYYGFGWVPVLPAFWLYAVHILMAVSGLCVAFGYHYRLAAVVLFLTFTYTELIDLTYYLNHYYFVSLVCLLLVATPNPLRGRGLFSPLPRGEGSGVGLWSIWMFKLQVAVVYVYAGLAKMNYDWLVLALPLKIWLPANDTLPLIGPLLRWEITAYVFSWAGMVYDCTIVFFLMWRRTRLLAYASVVVFHVLTGLMFQIGVFPLVMMGAALIFFPAEWHGKMISGFGLRIAELKRRSRRLRDLQFGQKLLETPFARRSSVRGASDRKHQITKTTTARFGQITAKTPLAENRSSIQPSKQTATLAFLAVFFLFQLLFPWRYLLYPGNLFWTEEGYRFSWRVMLMEKAGTATFYVKDTRTGREGEVVNGEFLNAHQEKQMAMQPDMILQFAHFLADHYAEHGVYEPQVRAEVYVTLNGRPSRLLIDPTVDLSKIQDGWQPKTWVLPDQ